MENFALDLSSMIIHIEYQRKRLLENPDAKKKMCGCRIELLNNFSSVMQKLMIRLCSRTIKYAEDFDIEKATAFEGLEHWFEQEMYEKMIVQTNVSNKMVLLFRLLQQDVDRRFFDRINHDFEDALQKIVDCRESDIDSMLEEVLDDVKKWFEMFVLNLLAIQINCQNIDDSIFADNDVPNDGMICATKSTPGKSCENCANTACNACCRVHDTLVQAGEMITLIVTREMLRTPGWIETFFETFLYYHTNVEAVTLRLDYRMFDKSDPLMFTDDCQARFEKAQSVFSKIQIKNYGGVVYGNYLENVRPYFTECDRKK